MTSAAAPMGSRRRPSSFVRSRCIAPLHFTKCVAAGGATAPPATETHKSQGTRPVPDAGQVPSARDGHHHICAVCAEAWLDAEADADVTGTATASLPLPPPFALAAPDAPATPDAPALLSPLTLTTATAFASAFAL